MRKWICVSNLVLQRLSGALIFLPQHGVTVFDYYQLPLQILVGPLHTFQLVLDIAELRPSRTTPSLSRF